MQGSQGTDTESAEKSSSEGAMQTSHTARPQRYIAKVSFAVKLGAVVSRGFNA